jgi:hypothetical protein
MNTGAAAGQQIMVFMTDFIMTEAEAEDNFESFVLPGASAYCLSLDKSCKRH